MCRINFLSYLLIGKVPNLIQYYGSTYGTVLIRGSLNYWTKMYVGTVHIHFYKIYPKFSLHEGGKAEAVPRGHHQRLHSRGIPKTGASSFGKVFLFLF
jgi:hypothetical protein